MGRNGGRRLSGRAAVRDLRWLHGIVPARGRCRCSQSSGSRCDRGCAASHMGGCLCLDQQNHRNGGFTTPVSQDDDGAERWTVMTTTTSRGSFAQLPPVRARATFLIYVKNTAVLARVDCHHIPRKI